MLFINTIIMYAIIGATVYGYVPKKAHRSPELVQNLRKFMFSTIVDKSSRTSQIRRVDNIQLFDTLNTTQVIPEVIEEMSLPELKTMIKELGGKPRNLRKNELKVELNQLLSLQFQRRDYSTDKSSSSSSFIPIYSQNTTTITEEITSNESKSKVAISSSSEELKIIADSLKAYLTSSSDNIMNDNATTTTTNYIIPSNDTISSTSNVKPLKTSNSKVKKMPTYTSTNSNSNNNNGNGKTVWKSSVLEAATTNNNNNNNSNNNNNDEGITTTLTDNIYKSSTTVTTTPINPRYNSSSSQQFHTDTESHNTHNTTSNGGGGGGVKRHFSVHQKFPTGYDRHSRTRGLSGSADMELTFLGTASCTPSTSRGVSCMALRSTSQMWLFDCGESTQLQLQKSSLRASKVNKIFITHTHGDHLFGLAGVLCMLGQASMDERDKARKSGEMVEPIEIYGPEGIRHYLRSVISLTYSRVVAPHRIHELKNIPYLHSHFVRKPIIDTNIQSQSSAYYGEVRGGRDIYPDAQGIFNVFEDEEFLIRAAPMQHTVPCVGFVIDEKEKPGRLNVEKASIYVEQNKDALNSIYGDYRRTYKVLKELKENETFRFPDGAIVSAADVVESPVEGRKVVYMGDTCNGDMIANIAQNATVLVHEATNAWDSTYDKEKFGTYQRMEYDTYCHGHSTPQMAGRFAKKINAKRLVLSHFSPRYRGDDSENSMKVMWKLEDMAKLGCDHFWGENDVIAAWDQMSLFV